LPQLRDAFPHQWREHSAKVRLLTSQSCHQSAFFLWQQILVLRALQNRYRPAGILGCFMARQKTSVAQQHQELLALLRNQKLPCLSWRKSPWVL